MSFSLSTYLKKETSIAPLAMFRFLMGMLMAVSMLRFYAKGWIETQYINPSFHFKYFGFEWIPVPSPTGLYILFAVLFLSFLAFAFGFLFRLASILCFILFTWLELMDATYYLNHYYFISIILFLCCFLPAAKGYSIDAYKRNTYHKSVPLWTVDVIKLQLAMVYIFAGIAKITPEWLLEANPLKIWLPMHANIPVLGYFFNKTWVAYAFSWFGMLYDVFIVFFLLYAPTRLWAYAVVIVFHLLTALLFPIGMFPWVMMLATLIFFSSDFQLKALKFIGLDRFNKESSNLVYSTSAWVYWVLGLHFSIQLVLPFRYILYPKGLFFHEQGYRYSWRVMLVEKMGYTQYYVKLPNTLQAIEVDNRAFLTAAQEKQMNIQPELMLQFAHHLAEEYGKDRHAETQVFVDAYVNIHNTGLKRLVKRDVDLNKIRDSFAHKPWLESFED